MAMIDLSVIVPSIRVEQLEKLHFLLERGIQPFSWEMIVIGPYDLPANIKNKENVKFFKDFGSPSRCVQIGSTLSEGKYLMWISDDCEFVSPNSISQCIQMFENGIAKREDAICLRYFEGQGNGEFPMEYWTARHHADQRIAGIKETFKLAPLGMYNSSYFREIGGLDCNYLHINMTTHQLAFRLQNAGGVVHLSPQTIASFSWSWNNPESGPVRRAYHENDRALFEQEWNQNQDNFIKIDYWNWINAESKWKFRF